MGFSRWYRLAAGVYLAVLVWQLAYVLPRVATARRLGWSYWFSGHQARVGSAESWTGLERGDRLLAYSGDSRCLHDFAHGCDSTALPGTRYSLLVERSGARLEWQLTLQGGPVPLHIPALGLLTQSIAFFTMGALLAWKRPDLAVARWGGWAGLGLAMQSLNGVDVMLITHGFFPPSAAELIRVLGPLPAWAGYRFLEAFPEPVAESRLWRQVRYLIGAVTIAVLVLAAPVEILRAIGCPGISYETYALCHGLVNWMNAGINVLVSTAAVGVLIRNYRASREGLPRRRMQWAVAGISVPTALFVVGQFGGMDWSQKSNLFLCAIPPVVAYAVLRDRLVDVGVVVRRGVQYLLARRSLEVILLVPVAVVVWRAWHHPEAAAPLLQPYGWTVGLFAGASLLLVLRGRLLAWLDRRFFRQAWNQERILAALLDTIRGQVHFEQTCEAVRQAIGQALHPTSYRFFYRPKRRLPLSDGELQIPDDHKFADTNLLVPCVGSGGALTGLLVLGPKRSEEPYSAADRALLDAIAAQVGLAHENYLLAGERVDAVMEDRNRIARELHDTLAQGFVGISIHLESARRLLRDDPEKSAGHLETARTLAKTSLAEARRSVHELREAARPPAGLAEQLSDMAGRLSSDFGVRITVAGAAPRGLPGEVASNLFRIAQEAVTNALKHASATSIEVRLDTEGEEVRLTVRDNGRGFDPSVENSGKYGLAGMRERVSRMRGTLHIESRPGEGTEVRAMARTA